MITNCWRVFAAALMLVLIGGCAAPAKRAAEPVTLELAGPASLDVESFGGDITVTADPSLDHTVVRLTREGRLGFERVGESLDTLEQITVDAEVVSGEVGPILRVRTHTEHPEPHLQRAHLDIRMPEVDGVFIRSQRGRVHLEDIQGEVDIEHRLGDVRILTNHPMNRSVRVHVVQGDIVYHTRGNSAGAVHCRAADGRVRHRVKFGRFDMQRQSRDNLLLGRLNEGDNVIELSTVDGDVYFGTFEHPTHVSPHRIRY